MGLTGKLTYMTTPEHVHVCGRDVVVFPLFSPIRRTLLLQLHSPQQQRRVRWSRRDRVGFLTLLVPIYPSYSSGEEVYTGTGRRIEAARRKRSSAMPCLPPTPRLVSHSFLCCCCCCCRPRRRIIMSHVLGRLRVGSVHARYLRRRGLVPYWRMYACLFHL